LGKFITVVWVIKAICNYSASSTDPIVPASVFFMF